MVVEYRKGKGWCTISCHHDPGKVIACFPTEEEADAQHKVISATKIEIDISSL